MNIFIYFLGMFLLYLPPLIVYWFSGTVDKIVTKIYLHTIIIFLSTGLTFLMFYLMPEIPLFVFSFYMLTFNLIYLLYNKLFKLPGEAFRIAIYSCFAISVLWEWPIQLTNTQNGYAVLLSGFKALGIPFLYLTLKHRGYELTRKHLVVLAVIILEGMVLTYNLTYMSVENLYTVLHLYRVYWLLGIILLIRATYINYNQSETNNKLGVML